MELHDLENEIGAWRKSCNGWQTGFGRAFSRQQLWLSFESHGKKVPSVIELTFLNNAYMKQRVADTEPLPFQISIIQRSPKAGY